MITTTDNDLYHALRDVILNVGDYGLRSQYLCLLDHITIYKINQVSNNSILYMEIFGIRVSESIPTATVYTDQYNIYKHIIKRLLSYIHQKFICMTYPEIKKLHRQNYFDSYVEYINSFNRIDKIQEHKKKLNLYRRLLPNINRVRYNPPFMNFDKYNSLSNIPHIQF